MQGIRWRFLDLRVCPDRTSSWKGLAQVRVANKNSGKIMRVRTVLFTYVQRGSFIISVLCRLH